MSNTTWLESGSVAVLAIISTASAAFGQVYEKSRFEISAGGYITTFDSTIRVDVNDVDLGTIIKLEDALGLEEQLTVFRVDGVWRIADRHKIEGRIYDFGRSAGIEIEEEIEFDGQTFVAGAFVESSIDLALFAISYQYSLIRRPRAELSIGAGLNTVDLKADLAAGATFEGDELISGAVSASEGLLAPVPTVNANGQYYLTKRLSLLGGADYFTLSIDALDGYLIDARAGAQFDFSENFAAIIEYNLVDIDVSSDIDDFRGAVSLKYDAIFASAKVSF